MTLSAIRRESGLFFFSGLHHQSCNSFAECKKRFVVHLKMTWRAALARHTCTTHRNKAPCEKDQSCAWVNPHPRGAPASMWVQRV